MSGVASVLEHPLVRAADEFATAAHASIGQLQAFTGFPYSAHTRAVARLVARFTSDPEVVAAGHLHDTIEDPKVAREVLASLFGEVVAHLVDEVSSKAPRTLPNRAARAAFEAARLATISSNGKLLKCCDVTVNMERIVERDVRFARVYVPEKRLLLPSLTGAPQEALRMAHEAVMAAEASLSSAVATPRCRP